MNYYYKKKTMVFWQEAIRAPEPPQGQVPIFSGPIKSEIVNVIPQTITLIGGVKGSSETIDGVPNANIRKFTKLFFNPINNTINNIATITPLGNFGFSPFANFVKPASLDVLLAKTVGDSFVLKTKCKINVFYIKNPSLGLWGSNIGLKSFTVKPGTYTLATRGLLPSLPQIGLNNQEVITSVTLKSIDDLTIGILSISPLFFSTAFSGNLTSNYFTKSLPN